MLRVKMKTFTFPFLVTTFNRVFHKTVKEVRVKSLTLSHPCLVSNKQAYHAVPLVHTTYKLTGLLAAIANSNVRMNFLRHIYTVQYFSPIVFPIVLSSLLLLSKCIASFFELHILCPIVYYCACIIERRIGN